MWILKDRFYGPIIIGLPLVATLALISGLGLYWYDGRGAVERVGASGRAGSKLLPLDDVRPVSFHLVNQDGRPVSARSYDGRVRLVFFGYTHCPDLCPTTLAKVSAALQQLGNAVSEVEPIFITVDPEHDDVVRLKAYMRSFHEEITALTGTPDQIARAAQAYNVYFRRIDRGDGRYFVDHSGMLYLQDRDGHLVGALGHDAGVKDIVHVLRRHL
jgi:protein SCO1/2